MLFALPLVAGGVMQGLKLVNPAIPFVDVAKAALMPFRMSTLGETLLLVGNFLFLFNVFGVIVSHLRTVGKTVYVDATAELEPAGVKP
jgi:cbb3-type cytochrome oxidase subunit 1